MAPMLDDGEGEIAVLVYSPGIVFAGCSTTTAWLNAGLRCMPSGLMCRVVISSPVTGLSGYM